MHTSVPVPVHQDLMELLPYQLGSWNVPFGRQPRTDRNMCSRVTSGKHLFGFQFSLQLSLQFSVIPSSSLLSSVSVHLYLRALYFLCERFLGAGSPGGRVVVFSMLTGFVRLLSKAAAETYISLQCLRICFPPKFSLLFIFGLGKIPKQRK